MSRSPRKEKIACRYFTWLLGRRDAVWQADGRSNRPGVGRHSLGTADYDEARRLLVQLDLTMAVERGLADPTALEPSPQQELPLEDGRRLYMDFVGRARVAGGARPSSRKRYKAVFDKFLEYAESKGLHSWNRITSRTLLAYVAHLEANGYAYRTQYLELTTIKQATLWMVKNGHLPAEGRIDLPLEKAEGTDTYCWRPEEVRAILDHCRRAPELAWLSEVLLVLATTGLRISELAALRWSDIDLDGGMIRLVDESGSGRRHGTLRAARTLKSGRGRAFPIQEELLPTLRGLRRHADGFVFHGPRGGRLKPDIVRRVLVRDVLGPLAERFPTPESEVGFAHGRLHSFRHFILLSVRQPRRAAARCHALARPHGEPDGGTLLPPVRRRGPSSDGADQTVRRRGRR